jgi:ABC-type lipoprotein export system ATPase subunit
VARTLAGNPSVILADEPTGSVDDETASEILGYFRLLKEDGKATILIATHGVVPDSLADRVVLMDAGRIAG